MHIEGSVFEYVCTSSAAGLRAASSIFPISTQCTKFLLLLSILLFRFWCWDIMPSSTERSLTRTQGPAQHQDPRPDTNKKHAHTLSWCILSTVIGLNPIVDSGWLRWFYNWSGTWHHQLSQSVPLFHPSTCSVPAPQRRTGSYRLLWWPAHGCPHMQQGALSRPASLPAHGTKWHLLSPRHKSHAAELRFLAVGVPEIKVKIKVKTKITCLCLLTLRGIWKYLSLKTFNKTIKATYN